MKARRIVIGRVVALLGLVICTAVPAAAQGFKWWQDDKFRRELGLTQEQSSRLEEIFRTSLPTLRTRMHAVDKAQQDFDRLVDHGDDASIMLQVDILEAAR